MKSNGFGTALGGLILLAGWVALCAFLFWRILTLNSGELSETLLQQLAWPFVVVLLAVPALGIVLLGGLRVLGEVLSLQEFLKDLPKHVRDIEKAANTLSKTRELIDSSQPVIAEAAAAIEESASQIADVEARLKKLSIANAGVPPTTSSGDLSGGDLAPALSAHLERARAIFDLAARKHDDAEGSAVLRVQGWILPKSVDELRQKKYLDSEQAAYLDAALEIDRRTRRSGRSNLNKEDIERLDRLAPRT